MLVCLGTYACLGFARVAIVQFVTEGTPISPVVIFLDKNP